MELALQYKHQEQCEGEAKMEVITIIQVKMRRYRLYNLERSIMHNTTSPDDRLKVRQVKDDVN
jgi:hypothetical protein